MCTRAAFVGRWVEARPNALRPSIVPLLRHTTLLPAHIRQHRSRRTTCPATETNHGGVAERQLPKPLQQQLASLGIAERDVLPLSAHYGFVENAEASLALIGGLNSKQLSAKLVAAHPELLCVQLDSWLDCELGAGYRYCPMIDSLPLCAHVTNHCYVIGAFACKVP